jgi:aspartate aminotransferase
MYLTVRFNLKGWYHGNKKIEKTADISDFLLSRASLALVPFAAFGADQESDWFRLSVGTCDLNQLSAMFEQLENALLELSH